MFRADCLVMHGFDYTTSGMGTTAAACLAVWLVMVAFSVRHYLIRWARHISASA